MTAVLFGRRKSVKLSEDIFLLILRNANSGVPHFDAQEVRPAPTADHHATLGRVAQSVGDQIEQDPFEQDEIGTDPSVIGYDPQPQLFLSRRRRKCRPDSLQQLIDWEFRDGRCKDAGVELGNVQERIEQIVHRSRGNVDLLDETYFFCLILLAAQLRDEQVQGMEWLPEIMACRCKKARLGEVRRLQLLIEMSELLRHSVDVGSQSAQLIAIDNFNALREFARRDLIEP